MNTRNKLVIKNICFKFFILFDCQERTGATLINKNPGKRIGNTVELKYGPQQKFSVSKTNNYWINNSEIYYIAINIRILLMIKAEVLFITTN